DSKNILKSRRMKFIERVSEPVVCNLLDELLERRVITEREMEEIAREPVRTKKAGVLIDTVRRKGPEASSALIDALCKVDPFLSEHLTLEPTQVVQDCNRGKDMNWICVCL
uniref:CARD domain-containing protein n=1 Tax=Anabas testudineus TaxID=64144 RepID=A0AAQ6IEH1_ANATE